MSKPTDFFNYKNGILCGDGVKLTSVADHTGTPVYVYSAAAFLKPLREIQAGLKGLDHTVCFAVKANSNVAVLKLLADAGAGMDLVSGGELFRAGIAGVPGNKIVFSGVGKTPGEIVKALEYRGSGIFSFNVESVSELSMIAAVARQSGRKATVALRFNPDVDAKTHPYISTGLKKNKFGLNRKEILDIARMIARSHQQSAKLGTRGFDGEFDSIEIKGLSIHIGSQLLTLAPLNDSFALARKLIDELESILPEPLTYVDLGGGIGISYNNEKPPELSKYCELIQKHFGRKAKLKHQKKILLEPGRAISGNSGVLLTEILHRKARSEKDFLIVDAAMNDLLRPSLYGSYHGVVPVEKKHASPKKSKKTDVVGPVCETGDCLASDRKLSASLQQGDLLAILSAGAYGFTMSGNYNSRPRPPEVLLQNGKIRVIRERETYEDLINGERI